MTMLMILYCFPEAICLSSQHDPIEMFQMCALLVMYNGMGRINKSFLKFLLLLKISSPALLLHTDGLGK